MSIPKEPRQLMINLMYLVLTALLALNVSAEVMNAFTAIDHSLEVSNANTDKSIADTEASLASLLKEEAKKKYRPIQPAITEIRESVKELGSYIGELRDKLIDRSGNNDGTVNDGDFVIKPGKKKKYKGKKNKDVTTRIFIDGDKSRNEEPQGPVLEEKIMATREKILATYKTLLTDHGKTFGLKAEEVTKNIADFEASLTLNVSEEWKESKDKKSWGEYKFKQMPVVAALPLLTQIFTDAKNAEAAAVSQLAGLSGGRVVEFNQFFPVLNAKSGYVIKGEKFEAEVSVGTYSDQINPSDVSISINGKSYRPNNDGKVKFSETAGSLGKRTLKLSCRVNNPLTGEAATGNSEFSYEVGLRSATVSADKMNVFYIGVDNPISVSAGGINSNQLRVAASGAGAKLTKAGGKFKYNVRVSSQGTSNITLSGGGLPKTSYKFRAKRIPDPVAQLGKKSGGLMGSGEMGAQRGILAMLKGFDFDARCQIIGYELSKTSPRKDPVVTTQRGNKFSGKAGNLIKSAKPGDQYFFMNVKAKCPGDKAGRKINSMAFKIK